MKTAIARIAEARGESEAVIVREAINALVLKEEAVAAQTPAPVAPAQPVKYKISRKPRKKVA